MKIYKYNGRYYRYNDGEAPEGAVALVDEAKAVEEEVMAKAKPTPKNKARKATETK